MGKTTEGVYVCDFCGEDTGKFDDETGNHPACTELAILRGAVQDVLSDFDLFGQPVSLAVLERLRKAYRRETNNV